MTKHVHGGNVYKYHDCIDFSANCNPLGTPERVKQAAAASLSHIADYPRVDCAPLKEAIGEYEKVKSEYILCGNGAADLIFSLCRAKKPKKALTLAPTFAEYEQALSSVDCEVKHFYLAKDREFHVTDAFLEVLTEELDMVFVCNPNNPTGILTEREFLKKVLKKCEELDIFLVVDECFLDFINEPDKYTLKTELEKYKNLFILKAFTKRYAMAGIRLGYCMCADRGVLEKMELMTQPWNVSTVAQEAGLAALEETEYVNAGRDLIFRESAWLKEEMKKLGLTVYPSQANYIFFQGPENFFGDCVEKGVLIRDCSNYPGLAEGYFRIAVKKHEDNKRLIQVFRELIK